MHDLTPIDAPLDRSWPQPWTEYLRRWPSIVFVTGALIGAIWLAFDSGGSGSDLFAAALLGSLASLALIALIPNVTRYPAHAHLTEDELVIRTFVGRKHRVRWDQIVERREFEAPTAMFGMNIRGFIWLVASSGDVIVLDGNLRGFDELRFIIRAKTSSVPVAGDSRPSWERALGLIRASRPTDPA